MIELEKLEEYIWRWNNHYKMLKEKVERAEAQTKECALTAEAMALNAACTAAQVTPEALDESEKGKEPETHDMPGVVAPDRRDEALREYPDPRWVLGPIY